MEPRSSPHPAWSTVARFAWPLALVVVVALVLHHVRRPDPEANIEHRSGETVLREVQALARLETTTLHVEKVLDLKDRQEQVGGLLRANDSLLYVAVGEVILGVDLAKIDAADVHFDPSTGTATIELPPPEILSTRLDETRSHVHSRSTDLFARRNDDLEGAARREALAAFAAAGRERSAMLAAQATAEKVLRVLAKGWGAKDLVVTWKVPASEIPLRITGSAEPSRR